VTERNETTCSVCDFTLYNHVPAKVLQISHVGVYNDDRFPGRSILTLNHHETNFETLDMSIMFQFMKDVQTVINAIKTVTKTDRVNIAILGNTVNHVHAHLIPRYPNNEEFPNKSPWNDKRINRELPEEEITHIMGLLGKELN